MLFLASMHHVSTLRFSGQVHPVLCSCWGTLTLTHVMLFIRAGDNCWSAQDICSRAVQHMRPMHYPAFVPVQAVPAHHHRSVLRTVNSAGMVTGCIGSDPQSQHSSTADRVSKLVVVQWQQPASLPGEGTKPTSKTL